MFPFDPWERFGRVPHERGERSWLDLWSDATQWWSQPSAADPEPWGEAGAQVLASLADGLSARVEGRRIELTLGGRPCAANVDWLRIRRTGMRLQARMELRDVDWDRLRIEKVSVAADSVRITPPAGVVITDVEIIGRCRLAPLIARLDRELDGWQLSVGVHGHVEAHRSGTAITLAVEPRVHAHQVSFELRGARAHRLRFNVPAWLRLGRTRMLPPLAYATSVQAASRSGDMVDFRLTVPSISERLDPARLRDAFSRTEPIP